MIQSRNRRAGITLIEILIAVSLLSLLSVGITRMKFLAMRPAMRIGFNTMEKTDAHMVKNRRVSNSRHIIENEIQGFVFTTALYRVQPDHPDLLSPAPFLQLEPETMRFVTTYSLEEAWRGRPQIAVLQVIPGEALPNQRKRGVRLVLNETPYTGQVQAGLDIVGIFPEPATGAMVTQFVPLAPNAQSFVLADRLAYCRFAYLEPIPVPPFQRWRQDWVQPQILPQGIRIDMAPLDEGAPSELHVTSVTIPLNVTRRTTGVYADRK